MPTSAPHACSAPGCPVLVPSGQGRCATHERKADRARGTAHSRGYDARWQKYRRTFLAANPLCVLCTAEARVTAATVVDHVRAHKGDQQLFWDPTNHRAVCKPHHDQRTDEGDFGRPANG
jgi:5-methylcytosine-specific restriction protein A